MRVREQRLRLVVEGDLGHEPIIARRAIEGQPPNDCVTFPLFQIHEADERASQGLLAEKL
jgi:hypothetical protein